MKKSKNNFIKILLLVVVTISNFIIPKAISLTNDEVKTNGIKGDIYNPQTNIIDNEAIINSRNYANNKTYESGDVEVKKIVSKTDALGKYKVEFKIRGKNATEGVVSIKPVYVVVVLDRSNSMRHDNKWTNAISASKMFATELLESIPTANLALVEFSGTRSNKNFSDAEVIRDFENENLDNTNFGDYGKNGGATNLGEGLRYAYNLLSSTSIPANAYKYVIVLSDGEPTLYTKDNGNSDGDSYSYDKNAHAYATTWSNNLKNKLNTHIFSVGYEITPGSKAETVLKEIANKESYYINANTSDILSKFKNVVTQFDVEYNAGYKVMINDKLGSAFTLASGNTTLNLDAINENWTSLGHFYITIDDASPKGWYPTNNGFEVNYKDYKGNDKQIKCNDNPEVYWEQEEYRYTVNYYFNGKEDPSFTRTNIAYLNDNVYAKDNYLEVINDKQFKEKNKNDNTAYFLDPNNDSNNYNIKISSNEDNNVLNIYYIDTKLINETINKKTDIKLIENTTTTIPYTIYYHVDINNIRKDDKITTTITDNLPYEIDLKNPNTNLNGGIYDKDSKTITWTFVCDITEFKETYSIYKKINYSVVYKDFADISSKINNNLINKAKGFTKVNDKETNGVDTNETVEVAIIGKIIINYVNKNNEKLTDTIIINDFVGKDYETIKKEFDKYTFAKVIGNVKGKIKEGTTEVTYIYELTPSSPKTGIDINNSNDYTRNILIFILFLISSLLIKKICLKILKH